MEVLKTLILAFALTTPLIVTAAPAMADASTGGDGEALWWHSFSHDANGDRVDDRLHEMALEAQMDGEPGRLVPTFVAYHQIPTDADRQVLEAYDGETIRLMENLEMAAAHLPADRLHELVQDHPEIGVIQWAPPQHATLSISVPTIKAGPSTHFSPQTAWELGFAGQGMVVGVIDTGVRDSHDFFTDLSNGEPKWLAGADFVGEDTPCTNPPDEQGHGTHVASTAVGNGGVNTFPYGGFSGVAPEAQLVEMRIAEGLTAESGAIVAAIDFAISWNKDIAAGNAPCPGVGLDDRIDVLTLSFGSLGNGGDGTGGGNVAMVNEAVSEGIAFTISAGNCGPGALACPPPFGGSESTVGSPAVADGAITVANSNDQNTITRGDDEISSSSSRGPRNDDGDSDSFDELKPEVAAPGSSIVAASASSDSGTTSLSGTSMAAPHVAGLSAILLQANLNCRPSVQDPNRPLWDDNIVHPLRDALIKSSETRTGGSIQDTGKFGRTWDNAWGYGLADADGAIAEVLSDTGACGAPPGGALSADAGGPYVAAAGEAIELLGTAVGGERPYAFSWSAPSGCSITDATSAQPTVTCASEGFHTFALTVTDDVGGTDSSDATVAVGTPSPLFSDDVESGTNGWTVENNGVQASQWHITENEASSPTHSWYHGVDALRQHPGSQDTTLVSPNIDLTSSTLARATLSFQIQGNMESGFDFLNIRWREVGGSWNNIDRIDGPIDTFELRSLQVPTAVGKEVQFGFQADSDDIIEFEGYYIDDISVDGLTLPSDTVAPSAPSNLDVTDAGTGDSLVLTWDAATDNLGVDQYNIYRSTSSGVTPTSGSLVGTSPSTMFTDTGLTEGTTYFYVVTAVDASGNEGAASNEGSGTPTADTTAPDPFTLTATDLNTDGEVKLDWTASTDAESGIQGYTVHRETTSGFTPDSSNEVDTTGGSTTQFLDGGLTNGQTYYYVILAENGAGLTTPSNEDSVVPTKETDAPAQVTGLSVTESVRLLLLDWDDSTDSDLDHYNVYRDGTVVATPDVSELDDRPLDAGVTFCYRVSAVDVRGNEGSLSDQACGTPLAAPSVDAWPQFHRSGFKAASTDETATFGNSPIRLAFTKLAAGTQSGPVIGDVTADGNREVVVGIDTDSGEMLRVQAFTFEPSSPGSPIGQFSELWTTELPRNSAFVVAHNEGFVATPALIQADDDDALEIVVQYAYRGDNVIADGGLALIDDDGTVLTSTSLGFTDAGRHPTVGNVDDDEATEVVIVQPASGAGPGAVLIFQASGGSLAQQGSYAFASNDAIGAPIIADLDLDGTNEIVAAHWENNNVGRVVVIDGGGGLLTEVLFDDGAPWGVATGDLDADGFNEIVVNGRTGQSLRVLDTTTNGDLSTLAEAASTRSGFLWNTPTIGDVDGDGTDDIVVANHDEFVNTPEQFGDVYVYSYVPGSTGEPLVEQARLLRGGVGDSTDRRVPGGVALANTDLDPALEIFFGSQDGLVHGLSFDPTDGLVEDWTRDGFGAIGAPVAIADITGDDKAEIVAASLGGSLVAYGLPNQQPALDPIGDKVGDEGSLLAFGVSASDPDGDPLTLTAAPLPSGATFTDNGDETGTFGWTPTFDQAGSYDITFAATDGSRTDEETITVTVQNVNRAPVLDPIGDKSVDEDTTLSFSVTASDPDTGETPALVASGVPAGATFTDNGDGTGSFDWTPNFDQAGTYDVTFTATDGDLTDDETITVAVDDVDRPPVLAPIDDQATRVGLQVTFDVSASDPDGDPISLGASNLPSGATFTDNGDGTGAFDWTPTTGQDGTHLVTITATSGSLSDSQNAEITVGSENVPPVVTVSGPTDVARGDEVTLAASVSDSDLSDPDQSLSWSVSAGPDVTGAVFVDNGDGTATWTWTVPDDRLQDVTVAFTASDSIDSDTEEHTLVLHVAPKAGPVFSPLEFSSNQRTNTLIVGEEVLLAARGSDEDDGVQSALFFPEGDTGETGIPASLNENALWTTTHTYTSAGDRDLVFKVIDGDGDEASAALPITVVVNQPPVVDAGPDQATDVREEGEISLVLAGSATDPEGRTLASSAYQWQLPASAGGDTLPGREVVHAFPAGKHVVTLSVTDPQGDTGTDTVTITVDDELFASAELDGADRLDNGIWVFDGPGDLAASEQTGVLTVLNDLGAGVGGATVTGTVAYYGLERNTLVSLSSDAIAGGTTAADGTFQLVIQPDEEGLWGVGYHELTLTIEADSRTGAPEPGPEETTLVVRYWVGPAPLGTTT